MQKSMETDTYGDKLDRQTGGWKQDRETDSYEDEARDI